ncbi:uncharacterized protein LOC104581463 [Brachypodium distachyon]|uniref:uncharacterized protein LOC104581463 n=1 Tax=Brachypodium distachyon TaxID=15368 RepID=UPI000D0D5E6C|nr:uncharacterized protein LOC104581463 [Brachypodium distachyon]|eukprot:XP_024311279.1 uncharacterized protein LOC104581463 [Brachypodium distachyon]
MIRGRWCNVRSNNMMIIVRLSLKLKDCMVFHFHTMTRYLPYTVKTLQLEKMWKAFDEAIANLEQEIPIEIDEDDEGSRATGKRPMASQSGATSGYKKARRERAQTRVNQDPMMALFGEVHGELKSVSVHVGTMAHAAIRELEMQEKASSEDPKEKLNKMALEELKRLGFRGSEIVRSSRIFVKEPDEIHMMMAMPENLRREFVLAMLKGK